MKTQNGLLFPLFKVNLLVKNKNVYLGEKGLLSEQKLNLNTLLFTWILQIIYISLLFTKRLQRAVLHQLWGFITEVLKKTVYTTISLKGQMHGNLVSLIYREKMYDLLK
jgi:hypothetical protein